MTNTKEAKTQKEVALLKDFAVVLKVNPKLDEAKTRTRVQIRLVKVGLGCTCGRCGGTGEYSYCSAYGTTCFQCGGSGMVAQKLSPSLLEQAKVKAQDGTLDAYLSDLNKRSAIKKVSDQIFAAWSKLPEIGLYWGFYNTNDLSIAWSANNTKCSAQHDRWQKVCNLPKNATPEQVDAVLHIGLDCISKIEQAAIECRTELETLLALPITPEIQEEANALRDAIEAKWDAYVAEETTKGNRHIGNNHWLIERECRAYPNKLVTRVMLLDVLKPTINLNGKETK